jgi:hypothetical protein
VFTAARASAMLFCLLSNKTKKKKCTVQEEEPNTAPQVSLESKLEQDKAIGIKDCAED